MRCLDEARKKAWSAFSKIRKMNKKGQNAFDTLARLGVTIAVLAVVLVVAFLIVGEGQDQIVALDDVNESNSSTFSAGYNATVTLQDAMNDIPPWVPVIVITVVGAALLGLVAMFRKHT